MTPLFSGYCAAMSMWVCFVTAFASRLEAEANVEKMYFFSPVCKLLALLLRLAVEDAKIQIKENQVFHQHVNCNKCVFWESYKADDLGECRFLPPQPVEIEAVQQFAWPKTSGDKWCGSGRPRFTTDVEELEYVTSEDAA